MTGKARVSVALLVLVGWLAVTRVGARDVDQAAAPLRIFAAVRDRSGGAMAGLSAADFELILDGQPAQFEIEPRTPRRFLLLLDFSTSMFGGANIHGESSSDDAVHVTGSRLESLWTDWARRGARALGAGLRPGDRARLGSFGAAGIVTPMADSAEALDAAWPLIRQGDGPSPIWDAVDSGVATLSAGDGQPVMILVTDGRATTSVRGFDEVLARAVRSSVTIYTTGPTAGLDRRLGDATALDPQTALDTLAQRTGGRLLVPGRGTDFADVVKRILDDLGKQYTFLVPSAEPKGPAAVDLRVHRNGASAVVRRAR